MNTYVDQVTWHMALENVRDALKATGVVVGLSVGDETPQILASGTSDRINGQTLQPHNRFRIGSLTKLFTAVVTLQLIEQGKLDYGQTIDTWLPQVPHSAEITIEHLLRHTSGLFNYTQSQAFLAAAGSRQSAWSAEELIAYATPENHAFTPGSSWLYSNTNYILLGMIIEKVTQQALVSVFRAYVFAPLHLNNTFFDGLEAIPHGFVPGYGPNPNDPTQQIEMTNLMHVSAAGSAGALVSTVTDLLQFSQALFQNQVLQPATMMNICTVNEPLFPLVTGYGMGMVRMNLGGKTAYGHLGNIPGYSAMLAYFPAEETHLVVLTNQDYSRLPSGEVNVEALAKVVLQAL